VPATETNGKCSLSLANYKLIKLTTFPFFYAFRWTFEIPFIAFFIIKVTYGHFRESIAQKSIKRKIKISMPRDNSC
jgi:hypothetical protein